MDPELSCGLVAHGGGGAGAGWSGSVGILPSDGSRHAANKHAHGPGSGRALTMTINVASGKEKSAVSGECNANA